MRMLDAFGNAGSLTGWTVVSLFILAVIIVTFIWALSVDGSDDYM